MFKQCELTSERHRIVLWVPSRLAIEGKVVTVEGFKGHWTVTKVYHTIPMTRSELSQRETIRRIWERDLKE